MVMVEKENFRVPLGFYSLSSCVIRSIKKVFARGFLTILKLKHLLILLIHEFS